MLASIVSPMGERYSSCLLSRQHLPHGEGLGSYPHFLLSSQGLLFSFHTALTPSRYRVMSHRLFGAVKDHRQTAAHTHANKHSPDPLPHVTSVKCKTTRRQRKSRPKTQKKQSPLGRCPSLGCEDCPISRLFMPMRSDGMVEVHVEQAIAGHAGSAPSTGSGQPSAGMTVKKSGVRRIKTVRGTHPTDLMI